VPDHLAPLSDDPLWYKDAIIYEAPVKSFRDSVGDGVGDFRGMIEKLDYLQDLGINALWLLPFYPSPLKDDGYDISDYMSVHPMYGTLEDFKDLLREAHRRGIRVITELVINHTSDQHPWFQRARRAPKGSVERDFYVWSDTPEKYKQARIIFKDFETSNWAYDPVAKAYYWHRFYSHQPDLNYDNPAVWEAIFPIVDFWFELGVDGMRLDAIPYLYEREGTSCENLPETHAFLKALRKHVDSKFRNKMFLAEANQWPEDAVAYFGEGDECHTAFHFPLMPRMFMAIRTEDRFPIVDILQQTPPIPETCQWCLFLRNHDELTLEMVTDEERDYMYRAYARDVQARINLGIRRRLAPLLGNNRRRIELMVGLLMSLPGTPVLYYGDEIGMGDNIYLGDRNAVRTPMQWSGDRNAGFSKANPQKLYLPVIIDPEYHYEAVNVEAQQNNPNSLLWWMKRIIDLRKRHKAFGRGSMEFLFPENPKILAFLRRYGEETILVVANLSRFTQHTELHLEAYAGLVPVEMFGRVEFPVIGKTPYSVMLGPHGFVWFSLQPRRPATLGLSSLPTQFPEITVRGNWERFIRGRQRQALEAILPDFLAQRRWFTGQQRQINQTVIQDVIHLTLQERTIFGCVVEVRYLEGEPEQYLLPLVTASGPEMSQVLEQLSHAVVAVLQGDENAVVYDALWDPHFTAMLWNVIREQQSVSGGGGKIVGVALPTIDPFPLAVPQPVQSRADQHNTVIQYGERAILKVFRRLDEGINPEWEVGRFLTERGFAHVPPVLGALEYRRPKSEPLTLAVLHAYVPSQGTAWHHVLNAVGHYLDWVLTSGVSEQTPPQLIRSIVELSEEMEPPALLVEAVGPFLDSVRLLGQRVAELHQVLASEEEEASFRGEPYTPLYQRSVYQSLRTEARRRLQRLQRFLSDSARENSISDADRHLVHAVLQSQDALLARLQLVASTPLQVQRYRCHGDLHLGQVLYTGKDFVFVDFEGDPRRSIGERRIKRSLVRDVARMLYSFHQAVQTAFVGHNGGPSGGHATVRPDDRQRLEPWCSYWQQWMAALFLRAYRQTAGGAPFVPASLREWRVLLEAFYLDNALAECQQALEGREGANLITACRAVLSVLQWPAPAN
jgi:maltose alpha-D-glucosyltransferase/alpha-amylase